MIMDPYSILGISKNASSDEVKRAYRELSRKYHPDSYVNNPLSGLAEEKFKEVQEAYDQIMKEREGGYSSGTSSYTQSSYANSSSEEPVEMRAVENYLNSRYYREALTTLSGLSYRSARWYYYSAIANAGLGNNIEARNHAEQAVNMEPRNPEYTNFLNQLQFKTQRYQSFGGGYNTGRSSSCGSGNLCCDLWCADSLCECMGGDMISCL